MEYVTQVNAWSVERGDDSATRLGEQINQVTDAVSVFKILANQVIDMPAASLEADAAQSSLKAVSGKEPTLPRDTDATRFLPDGEQPVRHPRTENGATPGKTPAPNSAIGSTS